MTLSALRVYHGLAPKELPMIVPVLLALQAGVSQRFDLTDLAEDQTFTTCQAVWIDNRANGGVFSLTPGGGMPTIYCPANSVGMFPVSTLAKMDFVASHDLQVDAMRLWLYNVPQPYFVYPVL
jgi:hypothetical protein